MHASVLGAIWTACRPGTRRICVLTELQALRSRKVHQSFPSCRSEDLPCGKNETNSDNLTDNPKTSEGKGDDHEDSNSKPSHNSLFRRMKNVTGSKLNKSRSDSNHGLPPILLPNWFLKNNVHYGGGCEPVNLSGQCPITQPHMEDENFLIKDSQVEEKKTPVPVTSYSVNYNVYTEILATVKAGLSLRPPKNTSTKVTLRPTTVLQCPKDGASIFLDHIVSKLCLDLGADLVQIDAQDIAQIVGPYLDENIAWNATITSLYGYNAQKVSGKLEDYETCRISGDQVPEQENQGTDETSNASVLGSIGISSSFVGEDFSKLLNVFVQKPRDKSKSTSWSHDENYHSCRSYDSVSGDQLKENAGQTQWNNLKVSAILKAVVEAVDLKRAAESESLNDNTADYSEKKSELIIPQNIIQSSLEINMRPLIIQIKDYLELRSLDGGIELLQRLHKIVNKKWLDGCQIICIGTTEGVETVYEKRGIQILQEDVIGSEKRTIIIPPDRKRLQDIQFKLDRRLRVRKINIRHLEDMILKLTEGSEILPIVDLEEGLDSTIVLTSGMEENVWTFGRIHRIAITILGLSDPNQPLLKGHKRFEGAALSRTLKVLSSSDEFKFAWGVEEIKECDASTAKLTDAKKTSRLTYNTYEKKLLSGVILPEKIRTTFADIRTSEEIIEALKTLTSLSLTRPEAFTYGILRRDKIPGILLYGPPGTGKTLLAKAVAKESGATVLEVTAADLNNMYVGEGEKNVKALFTLAKKLSPCVIFIDEADSMFGSREGSRQRASHREMINQFLREWDGISDFSGFIMVATNRPYDLDDAILRRLPRRLLVDLPLEKDREEILKIHLKDEILDSSVSLSALARNTPYYSGSDLKNLCVAAALACVCEEKEVAAELSCDASYEYPKTRLLAKRHFDKAIEEISASVNEDMSSLKAIKKFDEKYGDRKGRRKKRPSLGFGSTRSVDEVDSDTARVRPLVNF